MPRLTIAKDLYEKSKKEREKELIKFNAAQKKKLEQLATKNQQEQQFKIMLDSDKQSKKSGKQISKLGITSLKSVAN